MVFSAKVAMRFLKSGKSQTIFIALGIAIGVSVQIFIGLLIQGLQQSLVNKTIGNSSQITVTSMKDDKLIGNWEDIVDKISSEKRIEKISVAADSSGFVRHDGKSEPVLVRGFLPDKADGIYNIKENIIEGEALNGDGQVLIGKEFRDKLELKLGDEIEIVNFEGKKSTLKVKGFYDLKVSSINKSWLIVNLKTSQDIFGFQNKVTGIEMQVADSDVFDTVDITKSVESIINNENLKVEDWQSQNAQLLSGLSGQSMSSIMIQVFVLVSVILGIASVLAITVMQKSKQIGILKAMGVKDRSSSLIFMFQGFFLGILGAIIGVVLGVGLIVMFSKFALNPDGTPVVPIYMNYGFIAFSGLIAVISAVAASLIPARKSSKLNPIEVIRNG
ncbi:ABC transporter permease [Pseudobacteroides cellulosolvens]|uniref:MacB-like periplasmic core domain containing protein n=1 Tax=Pseudobacteroides cellulosolvens ATCC 35603 = DSM 2933 TaxID=398512 RepID=A0A0L6JP23_9FIRM|nr:ABC transporter permease [Pseudobacteroides cellulosolvens]KNY27528.1 MacB-like periplasmic core domain containing protein [Pseudobacteroides cellulosolvens ATCC 35603 = DSM 2933]